MKITEALKSLENSWSREEILTKIKNGEDSEKIVEESPDEKMTKEKSDISTSVMDDPNVIRSEIDDIRKSVVSMSVGQPDRTTTIVKEWLEQPAPAAPASEPADAPAESGGGDDAATDESGKG